MLMLLMVMVMLMVVVVVGATFVLSDLCTIHTINVSKQKCRYS